MANAKQLQPLPQHMLKTYDEEALATRTTARVIGHADSILLGSQIQVDASNDWWNKFSQVGYQAHRWKIMLADLSAFTDDPTVVTLGQNYHMLGHMYFTQRFAFQNPPKVNPVLRTYVGQFEGESISLSNGTSFMTALEDARVERLMIALFPSTRPYFVASSYARVAHLMTVAKTIGPMTAEALTAAYLFLAARPYIAANLRLAALREINGNFGVGLDDGDVTSALMEYVGASTEKTSPSDLFSRSLDSLLSTLPRTALAASVMEMVLKSEGLAALVNTCSLSRVESAETQEDQTELQQAAATQQGSGEQQDGGQSQQGDGESESDQDDSQGQGEGDGDDEDGDDPQDDSDGQNGDGQSDSQSTDGGGGASSTGTGGKPQDAPLDFESMLDRAEQVVQSEISQSPESGDEIERIKAARKSDGGFFSATNPAVRHATPSDSFRLVARLMEREFGKILEDADPGFKTHQASGKINMRRAMAGINDYDTAFDLWDEGKSEASSFEVALLIDTSASMRDVLDDVHQASWAITRGIESLGTNVKVTTFSFDTSSTLLKTGEERIGTQYLVTGTGGGTDPSTALVDASRILMRSKRAHKICLILTDGDWGGLYGEDAYRRLINNMQSTGVHVGIAFMDTDGPYGGSSYRLDVGKAEQKYRRGADSFSVLSDTQSFVQMARNIVKEEMSRG
jgi:hypothetical protein